MVSNTQPQFITDFNGEKISVILPINEYNELLQITELYEDLEDLELYYEAKKNNEPSELADVVFSRIEKNRRQNGK